MTKDELFSGERRRSGIFVWLSNQQEILAACPERFKTYGEWSDSAAACWTAGPRDATASGAWRHDDLALRERQLTCVDVIVMTNGYDHHDKLAVISWMLSEMFESPPRLTPALRGMVLEENPPLPFAES